MDVHSLVLVGRDLRQIRGGLSQARIKQSSTLTDFYAEGSMRVFSGQGEIPYRRYAAQSWRARERLPLEGSSRSGEMPEPTVKVRMKENARAEPQMAVSVRT
jgi:hypothetical protein